MGDLTENFSRKEFACKCGCGFDEIDERLVNRLQVIRDISGLPIKINSGCRCQKHNKDVDGESLSFHLLGEAADWCFDCPYDEKLYFYTSVQLNDWSGGFHYYREQRFFHCDIGPRRRW
jgi:uncharacterized protein YcbK (DUF882 family)